MASAPLQHIAFIMDGNGRWASRQGIGRHKGHEEGAKTLQTIIRNLGERNIPQATFFVFSSENWGRPDAEVKALLSLLRYYLKKDLKEAHKNNVRLRFMGDRGENSALSREMRRLLANAEEETSQNTGLQVNLCINYGGRDEIVRAAQAFAMKVKNSEAQPEDLTEESFTSFCDIPGPAVDLCIRTGGEKRLSNFILWHLNYAELFFTKTFWPAFDVAELTEILERFEGRNRRFGKLPQNLSIN